MERKERLGTVSDGGAATSLVLSLSAFGLCRSLSPTTRTPIIRLFFIFFGLIIGGNGFIYLKNK